MSIIKIDSNSLKNFIQILICIILISILNCSKNETLEVSEQEIVSIKNEQYEDIGVNPQQIVNNLKTVKEYQDVLKFIKERGSKNNRMARKLDFDTFQLIEDIWTKNGLRININYIINNNEIKYGLIESIDSNYVEIFGEEEFFRDENFLFSYISNHNEMYGTNKEIHDFLSEIIYKRDKVRIACGYDAKGYGRREIELFRAIKSEDVDYIVKLLTSMNPEEQTLGIVGIEKLMKNGYKSSKRENEIIKHLKNRNTSIFACITCAGSVFKLKKYLDSYDWSYIPNIEI